MAVRRKFEGAQLERDTLDGAFYDDGPIIEWVQEALGDSPWKCPQLRDVLDTPSQDTLRALQSRRSGFHGVLLDNEQLRETMRQVEYRVEDELKPSDSIWHQNQRAINTLSAW